MDCTCTQLPYGETGYFSKLVDAYIRGDEKLKDFYHYPVSVEGFRAAISARQKFPTNRSVLVDELAAQYEGIKMSAALSNNIQLLKHDNTFTVCTAHQPAIFTGTLYFVYKIIHAIKLAEDLKSLFPEQNFVPVFYMGSEDADLDELGHIFLNGEKVAWNTAQTGAIGRMDTKGLDQVIQRISGELSVERHGDELMHLLKNCYLGSRSIQEATLKLIDHLFGRYGLVVLIPDARNLKKLLLPVFEEELFNPVSSTIVETTLDKLTEHFKVQAHPRSINLFYLKDDLRERIEKEGDVWTVVNTDITFDAAALKKELHEYPERFSPNVILRGILQETILPGVAFIGGGSEIAYWLELKDVFSHYHVHFPVLVQRNSFLIIEKKWKEKLDGLKISVADVFKPLPELMNRLVVMESDKKLSLAEEITHANSYYDKLKMYAQEVDGTLSGHVAALQTRAIRPLQELEKKLIRAEKRKFEAQERQLQSIKSVLFPNGSLQERVDNFMPWYARWGEKFIDMIYQHSPTLDQSFSVIVTN